MVSLYPLESLIVHLTNHIYLIFQSSLQGLGKQLKSTHIIVSVTDEPPLSPQMCLAVSAKCNLNCELTGWRACIRHTSWECVLHLLMYYM